jgi:hypothetical protein
MNRGSPCKMTCLRSRLQAQRFPAGRTSRRSKTLLWLATVEPFVQFGLDLVGNVVEGVDRPL